MNLVMLSLNLSLKGQWYNLKQANMYLVDTQAHNF